VHAASNYDHPVQQKIRAWLEPPAHIHYMTDNLAAFLASGTVGALEPSTARGMSQGDSRA